jgi:hypothetical protein
MLAFNFQISFLRTNKSDRPILPANSASQFCRPILPAISAGQVCWPSLPAKSAGSQIGVPNWGPKSGSQIGFQIGIPNWGPKSGSLIGVPYHPQIRVLNRGPKSGSHIGVPYHPLCLLTCPCSLLKCAFRKNAKMSKCPNVQIDGGQSYSKAYGTTGYKAYTL